MIMAVWIKIPATLVIAIIVISYIVLPTFPPTPDDPFTSWVFAGIVGFERFLYIGAIFAVVLFFLWMNGSLIGLFGKVGVALLLSFVAYLFMWYGIPVIIDLLHGFNIIDAELVRTINEFRAYNGLIE